ncbi:uncharacterized protein BJ171DRAFT_239919 [Polychytrium aggregatum]|uniref:uncharacterized protein n=1 Tax=Polychytrium aggregatum TaxID=110093 RepID=UPI0022FDCC6D|nr:uncharacterized protein BJ171DRAFT_239919 [Polychytrium aggregatum]KAI9197109.1 hypothetical protein BJ171DRAFT_239919 [Polychytrium aggregatum]
MAKIITKDFGFDVAADDEAIFQYTRRYIIALIQKITYEQYLPAVLGVLMPVYNDTMYDPQIDPSVDLFFANVAMRYGHTATSSVVMRLNENGTVIPQSHILLRDSTFNLSYIFEAGLEPIARGFLFQPEQMVDYHFVEDIRSYLPINAPDGFDLAAIGIERGRELGLPDYNAARAFFNLSSISSYADLISDPHIQSILSSLYPNISDLDAYVGAMCEPPNPPAIFGSLIQSSIYDQFTRLRAGDRFFYRRSGVLDSYLSSKLSTMNLGQLVQMNLNIQYFPRNPFVVPQVSDIPAFFKGLSVQDTSTQDLSQTSAGYSYLFTSDYRISWDIRQTDGYIDITLEYNGTGWFGFGLGVDMSNADIYIVDYNSSTTVTVLDCYSSNFQQPNLDTDLGGVNNVMNLRTVVGATSGSRVVVSFSRLLNTGDQYDFVITQSTMPVIFAFTDTQTLGYHGPLNRGHALINFFDLSATNVTATGTASSPDSIFFLKALHGATMFISFGMMAPLSTFVARYSTKMDSWLNIHQAMSSFIFIQVLIAAASAIVGGYATDKGSVHAVLGFTTAGLICICTISGIITAGWKNVPFVLNNTYWVRAVHNTSAYICVVLGIINGYYGLVKITAGWSYSLVIINLYITWMVIFPTALLFYGEYSLRNKAASSQPDSGNLNTVKLQALPNFTWEDINSRVVLGSKWIVVFNVIYDLGSFIEKHPGGSNLLNHIGMDATLEFQGQNPGSHPHSRLAHFILSGFAVGRLSATQAMNLSSAGLMTRERSVKKTEELKTVVASMFRPSTVKQSKDPETGGKDSRPPGGSQPPVGVINPLQYTLLKISSRTLVSTPRSSREIYLIVCDFARSEDTVCFRPGDHVAFQYVASNGDVVTRHYTPIECTCVGSLKIFVKIYPNGKMSQYLKSASCIRVRGPLSDPMIKFNPMHPHGCFDRLGLICGGSGITPMLLILDYYSKYGQQHLSPRATSSVISMVITNHSEDDIFGQDILQRYQREFGSSLTITNLVHQVNTSWSGRKGRLDKCVLVETMPEPCSVKLDVQMTARAPRQSVGIGRIMFSAQGDNFGKFI